jgi:hypothetical protein
VISESVGWHELAAPIGLGLIGLLFFAILSGRITALQQRIGSLSRIEAKVDLLLKQANIKYDPYANISSEIAEAVRSGQTIKAIKLYRESRGVGLKEARDFIVEMQGRAGMS